MFNFEVFGQTAKITPEAEEKGPPFYKYYFENTLFVLYNIGIEWMVNNLDTGKMLKLKGFAEV